jgi:general secretion pathway protein F
MRFQLTLLERGGAIVRRSVEAASEPAARATLGPGERAIDCRGEPTARLTRMRGRRELLGFCEALEQVLAGGLTLAEALRALAADSDSRGAVIAAALLRELDGGLSPAQAFEATGLGWSPFMLALVRSGERSGQLPQALERFVRFERSLLEMRARVVSASMYPMVLLAVSLLVLMFLLGFVVPKFAAALEDLRTDLPAASRLIIDIGGWIGANAGLLGFAVAAAALAAGAVTAAPELRQQLARVLGRLPGIREIGALAGRAQALRVTAALLGGGATFPAALAVARATSNPAVSQQLARAAASVERGAAPSQALSAAGLAGPVATQLLTAAERTGGLAACFERLAQADEVRLGRLLERLATAWGPLLLLAVAIVVGGVVLALYWPLLQVFESIR